MKTLPICMVCLILGTGLAAIIHAAEVEIVPDDRQQGEWFAFSVSISEGIAIAGAPFKGDRGAAYIAVLDKGNWREQVKLVAEDLAPENWFGFSVSISEGTAIIGAPLHSVGDVKWTGAAYIFGRRDQNKKEWEEKAKLVAEDAGEKAEFGHSVAISGDTAIVGAYLDPHEGRKKAGSAYIFVSEKGVWEQQAKLTPDDAEAGDSFGKSVAIHKHTAIVGAHLDNDGGSKSGSAYIFVRDGNNWTQQAKLTASDAAARDEFGTSVSISGSTAIVGSPLDDDAGGKSGSVYIFASNGGVWTERAKLTASDAAAGDEFGRAIAIDVNRAIVGARLHDARKPDSGAVYAFSRVAGVWIEQSKTVHKKEAEADEFGNAVAISEDFAIIGAYRRNLPDKGGMCCDLGVDGGSAYIFHTAEDLNAPLSVEQSILRATTLGQVKRSALFQNFPNPFNPETWIPYALAHDASVNIRIYDVQGQLVRQMGLGQRPVGNYLTREAAAYWDGKDQLGEAVSSGVYFYTLKADTFQATRRMVILK